MTEDRRVEREGEAGHSHGRRRLRDQPGLRMRMAALPKRIAHQHRQLETLFEMVESTLGRRSSEGLRPTEVALGRFRDALDAHMTLEDQVHFPALRGLCPEVGAQLAGLVCEHAEFRVDLDALRDLVASGSTESCREAFALLRSRFHDHEEREEILVSRLER